MTSEKRSAKLQKDHVSIKILSDLENLINDFNAAISDTRHREYQFKIAFAICGFLCPLLKPLQFPGANDIEKEQQKLAKIYLETLVKFGKCLVQFDTISYQIDQLTKQKINTKIAEVNTLLKRQQNLLYMFIILFGGNGNYLQQKLPFDRTKLLEDPKLKKLLTGLTKSTKIYLKTVCRKLSQVGPEKDFLSEAEKWYKLICAAIKIYADLRQKILILSGAIVAILFAVSAGFSLSTPVFVTFKIAWSTPVASILSSIFTTATTIANFLIYRNTLPGLFLAIGGGDFPLQGFLTYIDDSVGMRKAIPGRILITPFAFFAAGFVAFCYYGLTAASLMNVLSGSSYWISLGIPSFFGIVAFITYFAIQTRAYYMLLTAPIKELVATVKQMNIGKIALVLSIDGLALFGIYATMFTGIDDFISAVLDISINITNPVHHAFLLIVSCLPTIGIAPFVLITTTKFAVTLLSLHKKQRATTESRVTPGKLVSSSLLFVINPLGNGLLTFPAAASDFIVKSANVVLSLSQIAMGSISVIGAFLASAGSGGLYLIDGDETKRSVKMIQQIVKSLTQNRDMVNSK